MLKLPGFPVTILALALSLAMGAQAAARADELAAYQRPDSIPYPAANPYSAAKAALGKQLFFDPRLSRDNDISCASCHVPEKGWEDGLATAVGADQLRNERHTPTVQNLAWSTALLWDGRTPTLESQVWFAISAHDEMAQDVGELMDELAAVPAYATAFAALFPERGISLITLSAAIATFERGIVSGDTPFDRWVAGDASALSAEARRGFALFTGEANCVACHSGWNFSDGKFHDTGLPASADSGRFRYSRDPADRHAFKTPGLRNLGRRAPYMHNGSLTSLPEVLAHYNSGFIERESLAPEMRALALGPADLQALLAFLAALDDADPPAAAAAQGALPSAARTTGEKTMASTIPPVSTAGAE